MNSLPSGDQLIIAVSKGRILKEALPLLAQVGISPLDDLNTTRKLILETTDPGVKMVVVRASDVPVLLTSAWLGKMSYWNTTAAITTNRWTSRLRVVA